MPRHTLHFPCPSLPVAGSLRPFVDLAGKDWETVILETDPTFWKLIQLRRKEPTISFKELKARLNRKR